MEIMQNENDKKIKEAIVNAVAYFDMFDYPLTDFEIFKYVSVKCNLSDIQEILESKILNNVLENKKGFYFLKGREEIIQTRLKRYIYTDRKMKRALKITRLYQIIPWIKMIAVSNVIGANNLKDESDIDLFIITESKKIWLTRFFCVSLAHVLGLRPKTGDTRDKICLNFYVSEEGMDLNKLTLENKDIYFIYWMSGLIPIYDKGITYNKFILMNDWIKDYIPNWQGVKMVNRRRSRNGIKIIKNIINILFGSFESKFKKIQIKKMPIELKELANKNTRVVINDRVLKLHVNDRREKYRKNYELRIP